MSRRVAFALALTALALTTSGCRQSNGQNQSDSGKPEVLTTTVLADLARNVQGTG